MPAEKKKKAPEFRIPLQDKTLVEGETAVFEVSVEAEPQATLKWTLNGVELIESNRVHFHDVDGNSKLEIHDVLLAEGGTIKCTATNSEGSATTDAQLTVTRRPKAPMFDRKPENQTVERGAEALFVAHAEGFPEVTYQWYVDCF